MPTYFYINGKEAASKNADGKALAGFPDPAFSPPPAPPGPVIVPYANTAMAKDLDKGTSKVLVVNKPAAMEDASHFSKSTGNEPATSALQKGFVTQQIQGKASFTGWSPDVKFEGKGVARHIDLMSMNNNGVPGNTPPQAYVDTQAPGAQKTSDTPTEKRNWKLICAHRQQEGLQPTKNFAVYSVICDQKVASNIYRDTLTITPDPQVKSMVFTGKSQGKETLYPEATLTQLFQNATLVTVFKEMVKYIRDYQTLKTTYDLNIDGTHATVAAYPDSHYELSLSLAFDKEAEPTWSKKNPTSPSKSLNTIINRKAKKSPAGFEKEVWKKVAKAKAKYRKIPGKLSPPSHEASGVVIFNGTEISIDITTLMNIKKLVTDLNKSIRNILNAIPKIGLSVEFDVSLLPLLTASSEWGLVEIENPLEVCKYWKIKIEGELISFSLAIQFGFSCDSKWVKVSAVIYFSIDLTFSVALSYQSPPEIENQEFKTGATATAVPALGAKIEAGLLGKIDVRGECEFTVEFSLNCYYQYDGFGKIGGKYGPLKIILEIQTCPFNFDCCLDDFFSGGKLFDDRIL